MPSRENSKAAKIRNYLAANADAKAADVVKGLKAERVTVTAAQVLALPFGFLFADITL